MPILQTMTALAAPWAQLYQNSKVLESGVAFAHFGGLLVSGGLAIATDRATLRSTALDPAGRARHLHELASVHRPVLIGLTLVFASGLLLFAADIETYMTSVAFWVKMGLVVLLLANALVMQGAEKKLVRDARDRRAWNVLKVTSASSLVLWLVITLAGIVLVNAA